MDSNSVSTFTFGICRHTAFGHHCWTVAIMKFQVKWIGKIHLMPPWITLAFFFFFFFFFEIKGTKRASVYFKLGASPHRPHGTLTALHLGLNSQLWLHPHMAHDVKVLRLLTHLLHMHMPNPTHTPPTNFIIAQRARGVNSNMEPAATTKEWKVSY